MQPTFQSGSNLSIKVIGVGRGGCNVINHMMEESLQGVEFIAVNTNSQAFQQFTASKKVRIGEKIHRGLDGGEDPHEGEIAAEYSANELAKVVRGADLIFIVSTLGGGVGTGASPVVARIAKKSGALTIGVVTQPFTFEGTRRMQKAVEGIKNLRKHVDTLIIFSDDLIDEIDKKASLFEAFKIIDHKIFQGIKGISDLLTIPNLICLNLAELNSLMNGGKFAHMTVGIASGEDRAREATLKAISSCPLDFSLNKADSILLNFTCSPDLALIEVKLGIDLIRESANPNVNILFGALIDQGLVDEFHVTAIAAGHERMNGQGLIRKFKHWNI